MSSSVLGILCKNAHSSHTELRISSLWALKHLVIQASNTVKMQVFHELGTVYLLQLLNGESPAGAQKNHLATANSRGEQVDLLNAEEESSMDVDEILSSSDDESLYGPVHRRGIREKYGPAEDYVARLRPMKNSEESATLKSKRDDVRIQHHVLDLLRNMLLDSTTSPADIVDNVLTSLGSNRFLDIMLSKLWPKTGTTGYATPSLAPTVRLPSLSGEFSDSNPSHTYIDTSVYQHEDILLCTLYILVHIANGKPAHRQVIVSHPGMLQALNPLFSYPASKIRVACVWLIHNILWVEDVPDTAGAKLRAGELRVAGIDKRIAEASEDADLDTKERAKGVVESFGKLLAPTSEINPRRVWER
jgi:armadillo repeat-containing protein 8